jgi:hypothetical protein
MKRLFDDSGVPPEVRADLLRSRRAGEDYDAVAKLPQLRAALADPSRQPDALSTSAGERMPSAGRLTWPPLHVAPWIWKIALLSAIGGLSILAAWPAHREARTERPALTKQQAETAATSTPIATKVEPRSEPLAPASVDVPTPPASIAQPPALSSRREIDQLVRIRALLERDPTAAYRLAQRSEREFPRGVLSEERQALQVVSLAKSGAAEAAARKAKQFFARYPESPMRELVQSALDQ